MEYRREGGRWDEGKGEKREDKVRMEGERSVCKETEKKEVEVQ